MKFLSLFVILVPSVLGGETWCENAGKYLSGYSSGEHNYNDLESAQSQCLLRSDCGGVTYETNSQKYTLRRGADLKASPSSEVSWKRCEKGGSCPRSHPFVYYNGDYCCNSNMEKVYAPQGTKCDGSTIAKESLCCRNDGYTPCPDKPCENYQTVVTADNDVPRSLTSNWVRIPGGLVQISKGISGVWGVNSNQDIFRLNDDGVSWTHIAGKLVQISSGAEVWGVNNADMIYKYVGGTAGWANIAGRLTNVDVSNSGHVWGINRGQNIYRYLGSNSWAQIAGAAIQVSVGESGVWVVNQGNNIYYRTGTFGDVDTAGSGWENVPGKLAWVGSGQNILVGTNAANFIFYRVGMTSEHPTGSKWVKVAGKLKTIDVEDLVVVGTNAGHAIFRTNVLGDSSLLSPGLTVSQNTVGWGGVADRAIDGNTDGRWSSASCMHSSGNSRNSWRARFAQVSKVDTVVIWNRMDACCTARINNARVYVGAVLCGEITYEAGKAAYEVGCNGAVGGAVIVVQSYNYLSLCEVQVFGEPTDELPLANVAKGKPAWTSSVGWGGVASRAVDGKGSGTWGHGTCTHSANAEHNVWKVDLIDDWKVDRIQISNRMDCCQNRLNGAKVFVGDELCGTIEYVAGKNWYVLDCEGKVGSTVSVSQTGQYLTLCEVMVLASPHDEDIGLINIVSKGVASQSSTGWNGDASRGIDGKVDGDYFEGLTCTHTGAPNGWWNLKLDDPQAISKVVIYNRADCCQDRINGVKVYADDFLCGTIRYVAGQKVYKVGCNSDEVKNVIASNIKIQSATGQYLTLCEVKVLADPRVAVGDDSLVNLALGKPTSQSSVGWGGVSSRAVDGNANGQWSGASCTHTSAAGWWNVDLKELYLVKSLTIKNRVDCCSNRINGVQVFVDDVLCGTIAFNPVKYVYHVECPEGGLVGENVKIVNSATYLTLCEVEVWGKGDPIVEDGTEVIVGSKSAAVDDSFSDADCTEAGMTITHCEVETGNVGVNSDGCLANANRCRAHNGAGGQGVIARAICSENPRRANPCGGDTNPLYNYQHAKGAAPKLECAAGYAPLECQAHSYWVQFLRNKNVGLDGIISNDHPCEVLGCNDNNWCEVSLICKLIQNTEEYREAVCPNCDNFVCGDAEVCEMDGDEPECVGQQIGCDDNEMCGDHGSCVPEGYDGYLCECEEGYEFDERAGTCLPKSSIYRKVYGDKAIGDDARSSAACNVGEVVMRCHTFGAPSAADGVTVHVNDEVATCEARASNSRKFPVMAVAYCGNAPEVKDPCTSDMIGTIEYRYGTGAAPSVSCPDGYIMDSCIMWSPWSQLYTATTKAQINSLGAVAVNEDGGCNVQDCLSNKEERLFCKLTAICRKLTGSEYVKAACPTCDQVECPSGQECQLASDLPVCLPRVPGGCEDDKCGEGECIEDGADYTCKCPAGYSFNEVTCVDVNECQELPCGNGECTNSPGSYSCACNDGYEAAKGTCVDVNECNDDPCDDSERCSNTEGSYVCDCLDSFIKDPKSNECVCADGYEASEGACVDVDECEADPCGDNQDCTNSVGNYLCECSEGFEMVESGACEEIQVMEDCRLKAAKSKIKAFKNTNVKIKLKGESKKTLKKNTKISWVRNGDKWNPKSDGKSTFNGFTLKKFGPEDAGEYVGTVLIDEDGVKSQCTILINIELLEGKVELVIANEKKLAKPQNSGEELVIKCDADIVNVKLKDPKSADNVSWYKVSPDEDVDDVRLEDDGDDISIIREQGSYQLVFANPSPEDSGTYRCEFDQQGVDASTDVTIEVV